MEDGQIIELFWRRNEQAISETDRKYGAYCRQISQNILANESDSEENLNDTYLQAWHSIPPQKPACLLAYLGRIARNLALNRYKARKSQKRGGDFAFSLEELDLCTPSGLTVESEWDRRRLGRSLNAFLHTQPGDVQVVFVRRYFFCDSIEAIAKRCGYSRSKVKSMLLRTRQRLRIYLEKEGYYEK